MKKIILGIFFCMAFLYNSKDVNAAFDLAITSAKYDCNTGILTMMDSNFTSSDVNGYYTAVLNKFRLDGFEISGTHYFMKGSLRVNIKDKNKLNAQINCTQDNIILNGLSLEYGAILKNTYPPNGINVVTSSPSNAQTINLNTIGVIPQTLIDSLTVDKSTISSNGGEIIITVGGSNLDLGTMQLFNHNTSMMHNITANKSNATIKVDIPKNSTNANRIDTFSLYLNGNETSKKITVTILPPTPNTDDNVVNKPNDNTNNSGSNDNANSDNIVNDDINNKDDTDIVDKDDVPKDDIKENTTTSKPKEKANIRAIYIMIPAVVLLTGTCFVLIYKFRKKL